MTEQSSSAIGTVAQEAARLIEDLAVMARASFEHVQDPSAYAGEPARERVPPTSPERADRKSAGRPGEPEGVDDGSRDSRADGFAANGPTPAGTCRTCGAEREHTRDDTPTTCRICPLCRGIAVLRSVRPETVDLLADLAMSVAGSLRDAATRSRAAEQTSSSRSHPGPQPYPGRASVQDIHVDGEGER